jgi:hypothetical protein
MGKALDERVETERQALLLDIVGAFRNVSCEDGITLHEAAVIDRRGSEADRVHARLLDTQSSWQDVPEDEIENHYSALAFFDAKALRYYIPAYMTCALKDFGSNSASFAVPIIDTIDAEHRGIFSKEQCIVMIRFCFFMNCFAFRCKDADEYARRIRRRWGANWDERIVERFRI